MWRGFNFINVLPAQSSDEENYQSSEENDPNNLVSPRRPRQSPTASPRALLQPDPPPIDEVLEGVNRQLENLPPREQRAARRNANREARELAEAEALAAEVAANPPEMVAFEEENGTDGEKVMDKL